MLVAPCLMPSLPDLIPGLRVPDVAPLAPDSHKLESVAGLEND